MSQPIGDPNISVPLLTQVPASLRQRIKVAAAQLDMTMQTFIETSLTDRVSCAEQLIREGRANDWPMPTN